jgi:uncharacterized membrane protein/nitrite reductase/ring-hydroxylating ferredoxin subunit
MRSTASIKSHPIHPMLIGFPIAFYTATLLFDVLSVTSERADYKLIAFYTGLLAIISAVAAAIPGTIDYFKTVPPNSSAKKRAGKHGMLNVTVLVLFTIAFVHRVRSEEINEVLILVLESIGLILTGIAGWLGGTLVYRNQIGVDVRYAESGKWKEAVGIRQETGGRAAGYEVRGTSELALNQMMLVHAGNKRIVVARTEEGLVAFDDRCTHKGGSLAGGSMMCGTVQCPWHGTQFSVRTGEIKAGPADKRISCYPIKEQNGSAFISGL